MLRMAQSPILKGERQSDPWTLQRPYIWCHQAGREINKWPDRALSWTNRRTGIERNVLIIEACNSIRLLWLESKGIKSTDFLSDAICCTLPLTIRYH